MFPVKVLSGTLKVSSRVVELILIIVDTVISPVLSSIKVNVELLEPLKV
jgi:hypothetical protein